MGLELVWSVLFRPSVALKLPSNAPEGSIKNTLSLFNGHSARPSRPWTRKKCLINPLRALKQAVLYFSEAVVGSSNVLKFNPTPLKRKKNALVGRGHNQEMALPFLD